MNDDNETKEVILDVLEQWKDTQFNIASETAREWLAECLSIAINDFNRARSSAVRAGDS